MGGNTTAALLSKGYTSLLIIVEAVNETLGGYVRLLVLRGKQWQTSQSDQITLWAYGVGRRLGSGMRRVNETDTDLSLNVTSLRLYGGSRNIRLTKRRFNDQRQYHRQ